MARFDPWTFDVGVALAVAGAGGALVVALWRRRRGAESGGASGVGQASRFVHVEDDGSARELEPDEIDYLNTAFHGADGAAPYIKARYDSLTPDGLMHGYLLRAALPVRVRVRALAELTAVETPEAAIAAAGAHFVRWLGPKGATPDGSLSATRTADGWSVAGAWSDAGGGLVVRLSAVSGRLMAYGVTSAPRTFTLPLGDPSGEITCTYAAGTAL